MVLPGKPPLAEVFLMLDDTTKGVLIGLRTSAICSLDEGRRSRDIKDERNKEENDCGNLE